MIIIPITRSHLSCVSRYYKGNDRVRINSREVTLAIGDIFDILSVTRFFLRGLRRSRMLRSKKKKISLLSLKIGNNFLLLFSQIITKENNAHYLAGILIPSVIIFSA